MKGYIAIKNRNGIVGIAYLCSKCGAMYPKKIKLKTMKNNMKNKKKKPKNKIYVYLFAGPLGVLDPQHIALEKSSGVFRKCARKGTHGSTRNAHDLGFVFDSFSELFRC